MNKAEREAPHDGSQPDDRQGGQIWVCNAFIHRYVAYIRLVSVHTHKQIIAKQSDAQPRRAAQQQAIDVRQCVQHVYYNRRPKCATTLRNGD